MCSVVNAPLGSAYRLLLSFHVSAIVYGRCQLAPSISFTCTLTDQEDSGIAQWLEGLAHVPKDPPSATLGF